jgi:hypothetical protein
LEVKMDGSVVDYSGTYEEYLRSQSLAGWCPLASFDEASVTSIVSKTNLGYSARTHSILKTEVKNITRFLFDIKNYSRFIKTIMGIEPTLG